MVNMPGWACSIVLDLAARLWISDNWPRRELDADLHARGPRRGRVYCCSGRVLRREPGLSCGCCAALRLIRAYHLLRDLRREESPFFRRHEDAVLAAVNLIVFIFVIDVAGLRAGLRGAGRRGGLCRRAVLSRWRR
jgi:voltage-gated potassium channel